MKIVKFEYQNEVLWGKYNDDDSSISTSIEGTKLLRTFEEVIDFFDTVAEADELFTERLSQMDVKLLAPVLPSKNVLCIGKNYHDHILEFDGSADDIARVKETPIFFSKTVSSITGPFQPILCHPQVTSEVDYEAELGVIIGKEGINISLDQALDYVYAYTILNDVTARDLQRKHQQWMKGKGLDTHCPIGPWLMTKDEIEDPQNLDIKSIINGEVRQNANTKLMMHSVAAQIAELSRGMTLMPGDVIATGTPKGVGMGFKPPKFLKPGDEVEIVIEKIGSLVNKVM